VAFTSIDYGLLLFATFVAYWLVPSRCAVGVLLLASAVFYASWSVPYLGLVGASAAIGYGGGLAIAGARRRTRLAYAALAVAVTLLLGLLAYFKYADFLLDVWSALVGREHAALHVVLPLAISFYTFEIVSYVVDVHRGASAETSFLRFSAFVAFFPHLIAGPIIRARELLPQLRARPAFDAARTIRALELLTYGLVKKMVFADNLGVVVDRVYTDAARAGGVDVVIATLAFGAQIYADFSGYTDIARGSAQLLGIELPINFDAPYLATSVTDFWRRWHITLSRWLRDYLYIPLGGGRRRPARVYFNLLLTMALAGLWHGASITFVLWGAYHGLWLVAERVSRTEAAASAGIRRLFRVAVTFAAVQLGWAVFRAGNWTTLTAIAARVCQEPLRSNAALGVGSFVPLILAFYALHYAAARVRSGRWSPAILIRPAIAGPALATAIALIVVFGRSTGTFIYFQF
jgi:alginate O-acetyltransferase complex protein AlgI